APGSRVVTVTVNGSGDLTALANPDGGLRTFSYDSGHRLTNDRFGPLNATYSYDSPPGALAGADQGLGSTLSVSPAATLGLATSPARSGPAVAVLTDALGQLTTCTLDSLARATKLQTPDGLSQSFTLNSAGQVTTYDYPPSLSTVSQYGSSG